MQRLPIGEQHFDLLRESNQIYIDKTETIHNLMNVGRFVFLARPRRFGKSLLTTTLRAIYEGKKKLFEGLWIEDKIDWEKRPVILLIVSLGVVFDYESRNLVDWMVES